MFTRGFFTQKTKKLLVFEKKITMLTKIMKITHILMKIVLVAIRKSQLASVCPWFGQKIFEAFFAHS
jgi:hypothetical protein